MMYYRDIFYFLLLLLLMCNYGSCLVVGAPSKLTLTTGAEGIKSSKLLVIITHPPPPAPLITPAGVAHLFASHSAPTAVSTSSLQTVHNTDPIVPSVTHTVTQINHPVSTSHHHAIPHPASTVNGHSLGYGAPTHIHTFHTFESPHENIYTVHVGGFGVGLHIGGHGHGHGYFAVL